MISPCALVQSELSEARQLSLGAGVAQRFEQRRVRQGQAGIGATADERQEVGQPLLIPIPQQLPEHRNSKTIAAHVPNQRDPSRPGIVGRSVRF